MQRGLYIHIPFCARKCRYCDFTSFESGDKAAYLDALEKEMLEYRGSDVDTVFIGGGTPSILSADYLERLLYDVRTSFSVSSEAEFSVEINPGTLTADKISALKSGGVNRISVGVQSFNDAELKALGRIHSAETAVKSVLDLSSAGFDNINIDLMTSVPYQTYDTLMSTLKTAVSLPVTHISAYSLILEEGTPLYDDYANGKFIPVDDDTDRDNFSGLVDFLASNGFKRYEISNFAKDGFCCRHNIKYWKCGEYIGLGLAAHSYINGVRFFNTSAMEKYLNGEFHIKNQPPLSQNDMMSEFMMMGLRMTEGISEEDFLKRFGKSITEVYEKKLKNFLKCGLILHKEGKYYLSRRGLDVSNSIMCEFLL